MNILIIPQMALARPSVNGVNIPNALIRIYGPWNWISPFFVLVPTPSSSYFTPAAEVLTGGIYSPRRWDLLKNALHPFVLSRNGVNRKIVQRRDARAKWTSTDAGPLFARKGHACYAFCVPNLNTWLPRTFPLREGYPRWKMRSFHLVGFQLKNARLE